mgnify:CR=1 FL=1
MFEQHALLRKPIKRRRFDHRVAVDSGMRPAPIVGQDEDYIRLLHGGRYTDVMVIYRAYKKQVIYDLELDKDEGYSTPERLFRTKISWEPLLSIRAAKRKLKIAEIPGDEPARIGGERKLQI